MTSLEEQPGSSFWTASILDVCVCVCDRDREHKRNRGKIHSLLLQGQSTPGSRASSQPPVQTDLHIPAQASGREGAAVYCADASLKVCRKGNGDR